MQTSGLVHSLNLSRGGVPKKPVGKALLLPLGFEGDGHNDMKHHGGPERAVSLWSLEVIRELSEEGHFLGPGAAGENVTVSGLPWSEVVPGVRLLLGAEVVVEVASFAAPCDTIEHCFVAGEFKRISHKLHPTVSRVYARVVQGGWVKSGDRVELSGDA